MKWTKYWTRDYTYHYVDVCIVAFNSKIEHVNLSSIKNIFFTRRNGNFSIYVNSEEKKNFEETNLNLYADSPEKLKFLFDSFESAAKRFYDSVNIPFKKGFENLPDKELYDSLKEYYEKSIGYILYVWIIWNLGETFTPKLIEYLTKKYEDEDLFKELVEYSITPIKKSTILLLDETISDIRKKGRKIDFEKLYEEFKWVPWGDLHAIPWTINDIKSYVENHKILEEKKIDFSKIKNELNLTKKETEMIDMNRTITYLKDLRDEYRRKAVYLSYFLYTEVAKRFGLTYDETMLYTTPELINIFDGKKLSREELEKRKGNSVMKMENGKSIVLYDKEMKNYLSSVGFEEDSVSDKVKGLAASKGKVKGRVCIVNLDKDIKKVKKDDIMIAVTTHPEYVPKMQIAKAIVTDEGGLTCHAAIVSRELGIPCVVGTKNATRVLKDGDIVEVDANKGVVRKI